MLTYERIKTKIKRVHKNKTRLEGKMIDDNIPYYERKISADIFNRGKCEIRIQPLFACLLIYPYTISFTK